MNELYIYMTPKNCKLTLTLDDKQVIIGYGPVGAHGRPNAFHFQLPEGTPRQGALLSMVPDQVGYLPRNQRGMVVPNPNGEVLFHADDFTLDEMPVISAPPTGEGELDEGKQEETGTKPPPVG